LLDNSGVVLIQYIGSELEAEDHPHGNSVNDSKLYIQSCTLTSVIQQIKDSDPSEFPSVFYKKSLSAASGPAASNASLQLRNRRQVVNHKALECQKLRLLMINCTTLTKSLMILMVFLQDCYVSRSCCCM